MKRCEWPKWFYPYKQGAFTVKRYYKTHLLKHVHNDFIMEFPNSVSPPNHAILNLI